MINFLKKSKQCLKKANVNSLLNIITLNQWLNILNCTKSKLTSTKIKLTLAKTKLTYAHMPPANRTKISHLP